MAKTAQPFPEKGKILKLGIPIEQIKLLRDKLNTHIDTYAHVNFEDRPVKISLKLTSAVFRPGTPVKTGTTSRTGSKRTRDESLFKEMLQLIKDWKELEKSISFWQLKGHITGAKSYHITIWYFESNQQGAYKIVE